MPNIILDEFATSHIAWFWGILAESTHEKGQRELHVYVPDLTPFRNGDVSGKGSTVTNDLFNVMTQSREKVDAHMSKTIIAEYLGWESSREVPDMYKGQQVLVMSYAGTRWFWMPLERDDYIKTFEHIKWRCADIAAIHKLPGSEKEDAARQINLHDDNTYFLEIDTKYKKHILLSTAGTDGEKFRYFFKIDANEHTVEIWDGTVNKGDQLFGKCLPIPCNSIKLESDPVMQSVQEKGSDSGKMLNGRITLQNAAGATFILEDVDVKLVVPRDLTITVGRNMVTHITQDKNDTILGDLHTKIFGNVWEWVGGFIKKHVVGLYTYLFENNRIEEVDMNYTRVVKLAVTEKAMSQIVNIDTNYTLTANAVLSLTGVNKAVLFSNNMTVISSANSMAFVAKHIVTTTHIFGCCGCSGH